MTVTRSPFRRWAAPISLAVACLGLSACGSGDPAVERTPLAAEVVVGSGSSVESALIAQIYAGALQRVGGHARVEPGTQERAASLTALDAGRITLVPDTSGALLNYLNPAASQVDPDAVYRLLNRSLPQGLSVSDYADAQERPTLVLPAAAARTEHVASVHDLTTQCKNLTVGVVPGKPAPGVEPLATAYGCRFASVRSYDPAELPTALATGQIEAALLPADSPAAADPRFTALDDNKYAYRAENVLPLFRTGSLSDTEVRKLNVVAGDLASPDLVEMVGEIRAGGNSADVARSWLDVQGI